MAQFSTDQLSKILGADVDSIVFRGVKQLEQSEVGHLELKMVGSECPQILFLKKIDVQGLRSRFNKPDSRWRINVLSFRNEFSFYTMLQNSPQQNTCLFPKPYFLETTQTGEKGEFDLCFTFLLEYLAPSDYEQFLELDETGTRRALRYLARFHSQFWMKVPSVQLFDRGCWWRKELRPSVNFNTIPDTFLGLCRDLPNFVSLNTDENHKLMAFLASSVHSISTKISQTPVRTIVHGDFKTSNMMFHKTTKYLRCIDFQWSGFGTGGGDLAYLISAGVQYDCLDKEHEFLQYYYKKMEKILGNAFTENYSFYRFLRDYKIEFIDYFSTSLPFLLHGLTPDLARANKSKYGWLTHEFDERVTFWFCKRALELIRELLDGTLV
eukprot:TRINITY_DN22390_c0_g1_i2.p1 TRINITY_DN22390_c0_g1~~TRINITY_DN22390_c0_g1_i2.p1  ORF type:complete len:396 (-),score=50.66 TRINITY_DN22390_c0_g1_i2:12-1154(-)